MIKQEKKTQLKNMIQNDIFMRVNWVEDKLFDLTGMSFYEACDNLFIEDSINEYDGGPDHKEVFEFYAVSDLLFDELKAMGAVVCDIPELDLKVWGRCDTGQSLTMDFELNELIK